MASFKCEFCNKTYSTLSNLNKHLKQAKFCRKIKNSFSDKKIESSSLTKTEEIKNNYNCLFCNKTFINQFSLNNHSLKCKYKNLFNNVAKETKEENLKLQNELFQLKLQLDQKTKLINNLDYNNLLNSEENDSTFLNSELYIDYVNFCNFEMNKNILIDYLICSKNNIIKSDDILSIEKQYHLKVLKYFNHLFLHFNEVNNILHICIKLNNKIDNKINKLSIDEQNKECNYILNFFKNFFFENNPQYLLSFFNKCISLLRELNLKNEISMDEFSLQMYKIVIIYQYISDNLNNLNDKLKIEF
jgi:hypothetical protein